MRPKERNYGVLVVTASEKTAGALSSVLVGPRYRPVRFAADAEAARRACSGHAYDFAIVDPPLPGGDGARLAIGMSASRETAVLLLTDADGYADAFGAVAGHGVFVLPKPLEGPMLSLALGWMESARERLRLLERGTPSVEEKLEEIRAVGLAKRLLMAERGFSEDRAHRHIEKAAMDRCVTKLAVAEEIIALLGHGGPDAPSRGTSPA